jgi:hypothetical protein
MWASVLVFWVSRQDLAAVFGHFSVICFRVAHLEAMSARCKHWPFVAIVRSPYPWMWCARSSLRQLRCGLSDFAAFSLPRNFGGVVTCRWDDLVVYTLKSQYASLLTCRSVARPERFSFRTEFTKICRMIVAITPVFFSRRLPSPNWPTVLTEKALLVVVV